MDAANASMYDECFCGCRVGNYSPGLQREKEPVSRTVHPETRAVSKTYAAGHDLVVEEVDFENGVTSKEHLLSSIGTDVCCLVPQQPNFLEI